MKKFDHKLVEKKWQKVWLKEGVYEPDFESAQKPFYNLMMFPYPSAEGLHIGSVRTFTGVDIYGRLKRMQGHDVFEPIGLDGFGINSENYALKIGQHPMDQAQVSEKNFYRQLQMIGNSFAWNEKLETYDPEYYKWTQWIFIQLFKKGLAYRKKASVNWCPSCLTVLADEQVIGGECERCGTKVIKKELEQWFFKITDYAERLLKGLDKIDWSEKVKITQRNWIGKSEGASIKFPLVNVPGQEDKKHFVEVFTTRPDTIFGATFIVVSPQLAQFWLDIGWQAPDNVKGYIKNNITPTPHEGRGPEKTGIFSGISAVNPANQEKIPVWVADYVLGGVGTGAIMAVPAHDERDFEFAKKYKLPVIKVIENDELPYIGSGKIINSGKFDGLDSEQAKWEMTKFVGGERKTQYRLRDWLISRQRYWGPPIPLVFCENCAGKIKSQKSNLKNKEDYNLGELENPGWIAIPEKDLPVKLPYIKNFRPTGTNESPLAADEKFYKVKCPKCGGPARRETDVSDTFLDSSWYYLGYLILGNEKSKIKSQKFEIDESIVKKWLPVNMYIGGAEHSVLHLLYVRFLAMVFHDLGLVNFEEPFPVFRAHGLITKDGAKMSKSKGNVVNPDSYIATYGADAVRLYLAFISPLSHDGDFRDAGIKGVTRFLERIWKLSQSPKTPTKGNNLDKKIHQTIKKVTEDIENLQYNTAVSALMILLNEFEANKDSVGPKEFEVFLQLLAPLAPHMSEEIWRTILKNKKSIHLSTWPKYDPELIKEDLVDLVVQINGKTRAIVKIDTGASQPQAEKLARSNENVSKYLSGQVKKIIFVKDKLINFVV